MASIIAAKSADVQYAIVGKSQNLEKEVAPDYNVGFVGTAALTKLNAFFTYMQSQGYTATRAARPLRMTGRYRRAYSVCYPSSQRLVTLPLQVQVCH